MYSPILTADTYPTFWDREKKRVSRAAWGSLQNQPFTKETVPYSMGGGLSNPMDPHPSPLTPHPSPLTPHPSPPHPHPLSDIHCQTIRNPSHFPPESQETRRRKALTCMHVCMPTRTLFFFFFFPTSCSIFPRMRSASEEATLRSQLLFRWAAGRGAVVMRLYLQVLYVCM